MSFFNIGMGLGNLLKGVASVNHRSDLSRLYEFPKKVKVFGMIFSGCFHRYKSSSGIQKPSWL